MNGRRGIMHSRPALKALCWLTRKLMPVVGICWLALALAEYLVQHRRK